VSMIINYVRNMFIVLAKVSTIVNYDSNTFIVQDTVSMIKIMIVTHL
jgi:hypothetical protein